MSLADPFRMLQEVCDRELGFQPLNFSIKPVHVANGLARALTGRSYTTEALAHTLRRYVVRQTLGVEQERHPNSEILEKYGDAFEPLGGSEPDPQRLSHLRALSLDVLGADGAVFDQADMSSYTLANERFVTKDPSDRRAGLFLARLLGANQGDADAAECLSELLKSESDGWTTLALPLLQFGTVRLEDTGSEAAERAAMGDHLFTVTDGQLDSRTLRVLRGSYDRLARFERIAGSKLNSLRRLVLFGCFVLHIHAIAYLQPGGNDAAREVGLATDVFSTDVEQAERWRNERDLEALIVVVARGDEAKLSSLEDFGMVTSQDLKGALVERAMGGPVGENDVQTLLWQMLAEDHAVGLGQLVDYYLSLEGKDSTDFKTASSRELHRVGLLPDPALFGSPTPSAMRKRLQSNREIVERLQVLTPKDRRTIKQAVEAETDLNERAKLREALEQLHRTRSAGAAMGFIDYDHAQRLVKVRTKKRSTSNGEPQQPALERSADVASEALVNHHRAKDLSAVLENLQQTLESADGSSVRTEKVRTQLADSSTETFSTVRLDVVNVVAKVLDDGVYGGLIQIDLDDMDDVLRRFNVQEHVVDRWKRGRIHEVLKHIGEVVEGGRVIAEYFDAYDTARTAILPYLRVLTAEPLVVAADAGARGKLLAAVRAYERLTHGLREHYGEIFEAVGSDVEELLGLLLLTDIVVVKAKERIFALLSPVHPLFLWHYVSYADVVAVQRDRLDDRDKALVANAARRLPNFLTSLYVPATALGRGKLLTCAGRLNQLPYYSDSVQGGASDDGVEAITELLAGFVAMEPHARRGLRVALIDPPGAGPYLRGMTDLRAADLLDGAHLVVYRHQPALSVKLRLAADDEERVGQVFRASKVDRRFTFEVRDRRGADVGPGGEEPFHVAVVFDRSTGRTTGARPAAHPIQPLAVPRRIHYSAVQKTVELEPASGGLFESYHKLVGRMVDGSGQAAYLAVHQQEALREKLRALAQRVAWTVVADGHVDRDLNIGALRIYTGSDGERDIAAFARSTAAFRRPLREVARRYNTFITDEELDDLLRQLSELLDSGLLNVKPAQSGRVNESRIKGLLGVSSNACG